MVRGGLGQSPDLLCNPPDQRLAYPPGRNLAVGGAGIGAAGESPEARPDPGRDPAVSLQPGRRGVGRQPLGTNRDRLRKSSADVPRPYPGRYPGADERLHQWAENIFIPSMACGRRVSSRGHTCFWRPFSPRRLSDCSPTRDVLAEAPLTNAIQKMHRKDALLVSAQIASVGTQYIQGMTGGILWSGN